MPGHPLALDIPVLKLKPGYNQSMVALGAIEHYPMESSAVEIINGNNGTAEVVNFNFSGPVPGKMAAEFTGTGSRIRVNVGSLTTRFDGRAGSISVFVYIAPGEWTSGQTRTVYTFGVNNDNRLLFQKGGTSNIIILSYVAGATTTSYTHTFNPQQAGWFHITITWDYAGDEVRFFLNGLQVSTTRKSLGTWVAATPLSEANTAIGALRSSSTAAVPLVGALSNLVIFNRALTRSEAPIVANKPLYQEISFMAIGDSKTANRRWSPYLVDLLTDGGARVGVERPSEIAQGGATTATIAGLIDAALATRFDDPTIVFCNVGVNDFGVIDPEDTVTNYRAILTSLRSWTDAPIGIMRPWKEGSDAAADEFADVLLPDIMDGFENIFIGPDEREYLPANTADGIHPTPAGYELTAQLWFESMGF